MPREFSQRATEVAEDLFERFDQEVAQRGLGWLPVAFSLSDGERMLTREEAHEWIRESVDGGFPFVRYVILEPDKGCLVADLAAFEDPDSQFHP